MAPSIQTSVSPRTSMLSTPVWFCISVRIRRRPLVRSLWADSRLRSGGVRDALRAPVPRQEFVDAPGGMIRQAGQHVGEPSLWIDVVELCGGDEGVDRRRTSAALIGAGEGPVSSAYGDSP